MSARLCGLRRCVSGLLCVFAEGHCACSDSTDLGRLSARATQLPTQVDTSGAGRSGRWWYAPKTDDGWVHTRAVFPCTVVTACCACVTGTRETLGVCARGSVCAAVSVWCVVTLFVEGTLRVVALSDPGRLSARATLFPKGESDHALPPHFAFRPRASGKVGPEHSLSPLCREATLTTGLSPLESLESHTHRAVMTRGVTRVMQLQAASRTCLLQTAPALVCIGAPLMPSRLSQ